tara:strand:- start:1219 stop:2772 length:1554 start_codon:yes stop_codon:yes gene_type:complete
VVTEQSPRQGITGIAEYLAAQGRNGDTNLTHTTTGETIIPEEILAKNPGLRKDLQLAFENEDIPMDQYVVGSGIMSVNPETGLYEAGWLKKTWKSVRKTVKKAGPIIGATVGFMIGGPVGASIGAGIGTKTSAMPKENILRNMAIAYGGSAALQGAGMGGAVSAAQNQGIGAFFNTANWTPMAGGQTGITGFFQNMGSGAARNFGFGGELALSNSQITALEAEMAASGVDSVTAAMNLGMDPKIVSHLGSTMGGGAYGPGALASFSGSYSALNPLEQWAVKTVGDVAMGIPQQTQGEMSGQGNAPAYMTRGLSSGPSIPNAPIQGSAPAGNNSGVLSLPGGSSSTMTSSGGQQPVSQYASALDRINRGNTLLETRGINSSLGMDSLAAPGLASLSTPFPTFAPPVYAQQGGFGQDLVMQQQPHNHPELHSHGDGFQQMNQGGRFVGDTRQMFAGGGVHMGGGQVSGPGGEKEDLINAKLSNNEFVMTADAVRGAGNGNINRGADQMYKMMNKFERMA